MDKLIKKANLAVIVGTSSWREQFIEALSVNGGILKFKVTLIKRINVFCFRVIQRLLKVYFELILLGNKSYQSSLIK